MAGGYHPRIQDPSSQPEPVVVGWRERVDLPAWGLRRVKAKIDTGARTSAIDVATIEELPGGRIRFEVVARLRPTRKTRWVTATPVRTSVVKPSSGHRQERLVCRTTLELGGRSHEIEVGLICRRNMLCRMLVGRTALAGVYHVDPAARYLASSPNRRARAVTPQEGEPTP